MQYWIFTFVATPTMTMPFERSAPDARDDYEGADTEATEQLAACRFRSRPMARCSRHA